ncbi:uncharacterized protein LOC122699517 isoform X2 [Cervus elaphus]|uniref:uncharacterized protein LOC122699517 isoform X2 n=2 Tax=Cervus elaphus TaxID=9860 RepID=UPI001CC28140|nr:uncharacterized protein LOC122699517 isoform X2 [Cervus elaphus]XP_043767494.1 uncharacterized protein LOC122699517 isoform X2 [Cervus elaphus]XP_043767495.1 uncharacterized protein LOC122699517 isoform X2 [Cervus elaphus]XP_043767496.1 uncharacterized protein LOC122699517 isoform X2 [Cervus elaphus]XP_043767497.1 uncharacterized protein LOC122699517 isoform X2 [Cervus elaphus]
MQTTLPSFPAGPSASSLPSTRCPASPRPMKPRQQHHFICPQQGCRGQEVARHTPPPPLGATLPTPPYQARHPPPWLLWGRHAGARCLPTPLPRAPAELGIQEQGLCPGLTGCPAWEEHVQPGLKRAPQVEVTTGGSCGTPLPSGPGSDLWGSGGSSSLHPWIPEIAKIPGPSQAHSRQSPPQVEGTCEYNCRPAQRCCPMATAGSWLPAGFIRLLLGAARGELGLSRPMDSMSTTPEGGCTGSRNRFLAGPVGPEHPLPCFRADVRRVDMWFMHCFINQVRLPRDTGFQGLPVSHSCCPGRDKPHPQIYQLPPGELQGQPRALLVGAQGTLKSQGPTVSAWLPLGRVGQPGVQLSHHRDLLRCPHREG